MTQVIVNGDDFGFTRSTNAGILRGHLEGILTSTTIMANGPAFEDAAAVALANPSLGVGCHVSVVDGTAVSAPAEIPSLVGADGRLPSSVIALTRNLGRSIRIGDVEREMSAQVQKVIDAGIAPSHLDTHKHAHMHPKILAALLRVAADFGIRRIRRPFEIIAPYVGGAAARARRRVHLKQWASSVATLSMAPYFNRAISRSGVLAPDRFYGIALTGLMDADAMISVLKGAVGGTVELMCHPGIHDGELDRAHTRLKESRVVELAALLDEGVRREIIERGIRLIDYRALQ